MIPTSSDPKSERNRLAGLLLQPIVLIGIMAGVAALAAASGTAATQKPLTAIVYDKALAAKLSDYPAVMNEVRPTITADLPEGPVMVSSCQDYLLLANRFRARYSPGYRTHPDGHGARAQQIHPYQDCVILRMLHASRQPASFIAPADGLGRAILSRLNPKTLGALAPFDMTQFHRLADVPAERVDTDGRRVSLVRGGAVWSIEAIGSIDILGDKLEDIVARITRDGTVHYAVLTVSRDGSLRARHPEDMLINDMQILIEHP